MEEKIEAVETEVIENDNNKEQFVDFVEDSEPNNEIDIKDVPTQDVPIRTFPSLDYEIEHAEEMTDVELMITIGVMAAKKRFEEHLIKGLKEQKKGKNIQKEIKNRINNEISLRERKIQSRNRLIELFSDVFIEKYIIPEKKTESDK